MASITVRSAIDASPEAVWAAIEDIEDHTAWMADATAIRITSVARRGVGTTFDCDTRVGPLRLTDRMEITEWDAGRAMGVRHVGLVTGTGRFTLTPTAGGATDFAWSETLVFPWWLGGAPGAAIGGLVLRLIWKRNLAALKRSIEAA